MFESFSHIENKRLIENVKKLLKEERECIHDIIIHLSLMEGRKLYVAAGFSNLVEYCVEVFGMTKNQAWKRAKAATLIEHFPEILDLIRKGDISVSHAAVIAPKLTEANYDKVIEGVRGKSKREAELFMSTMNLDGTTIEREEQVEIRFVCPKSVLEKLQRAMEVMSSQVEEHKISQVVEKALDTYLDKNDPMLKARRAQKREEKRLMEISEESIEDTQSDPLERSEVMREGLATPPQKGEDSNDKELIPGEKKNRNRYIPASVRHAVMVRDEGCCTYVSPDGKRCKETKYLEFDHIRPFSHGGGHEVENVRLTCKTHNQFFADQLLGKEFMDSKRLE